MVSTLFMVDTSSHPGTQLHRCVEKSAFVCCTSCDHCCDLVDDLVLNRLHELVLFVREGEVGLIGRP